MVIKENSTRRKVIKIVLIVLAVLAAFLLIRYLIGQMAPEVIEIFEDGDAQALADYLESAGGWQGMLIIFAASFIQVVSIVIPGMVIQIAAGIVYGWKKAFLVCFFGYWSANVAVFLTAKRVGDKKLKNYTMSGKTVWLMEKLNGTSPAFFVMLACMIPGVPNGIIPYISSRAHIRVWEFGLAVAVGCWFPILCNCVAGSFVIQGEFLFTAITLIIQVLGIGVVVWKREWFFALSSRLSKKK